MEGFSKLSWDAPVEEDLLCFFKKDVFESCSATYHQMYGLHQTRWPETNDVEQISSSTAKVVEWDPVKLKREKIESAGPQGTLVKIQLPRPFPRYSNLSALDQKNYIHIMLRVMKSSMAGVPHDAMEMMLFKELQEKVKDENQEFQKFAQQLVAEKPIIYSYSSPNITQYSNSAWKSNLPIVQSYPAYYTPRGSASLIPKEITKTCTLTVEKTVLEVGQVPRIIFPPNNTTVQFMRISQKISTRFPPEADKRPSVSKDANAKKIAQKYGVDFVLSASVVKTLAANVGPLYREAWEIPFTVVEEKTTDGIKKIVYLDKPLPPKEMSAADRNFIFNVAASKFQLTKKGFRQTYFYPGSMTIDPMSSTEPFDTGYADLSELETFGVDVKTPLTVPKSAVPKSPVPTSPVPTSPIPTSPPLSKSPTPKSPPLSKISVPERDEIKSPESMKPPAPMSVIESNESSIPSESDSECSLVIDMDGSPPKKKAKPAPPPRRRIMTRSAKKEAETKLTEEEEVSNSETKSVSEIGDPEKAKPISKEKTKPKAAGTDQASNLLNSILQGQEKMMKDGKKKIKTEVPVDRPEDPKEYHPILNEDNATYRVWALKGNEDQIRLLIRTSIDAIHITQTQEILPYLIVPKLEYQPWFGAENLTIGEYYQQWIDCLVRPGCRIFRPRLDVYTGDMMKQEQRDIAYLTSDSTYRYGLQYQAPNCLSTLWAVLTSLRDLNLSCGSYLLQHGSLDGISVRVMQATDKETSTYDLHQTYANVDTSAVAVKQISDQWVPLDPWTVLPVQRTLGRAPLTFEPVEDKTFKRNVKNVQTGKTGKAGKGVKKAAAKNVKKKVNQ